MLIVVDPHSGVPVYRQLIEQFRFHVASGILKPGDEIPSTRVLSARIGVNPMTISRAYRALELEGLVERRPGLTLMVRPKADDAMRDARLSELEARLGPVITMVRQLGIENQEALDLFQRLLAGDAARQDEDR